MIVRSGQHLREEREKIGLSQAKLAEISKIPQHVLSAYELGKGDLSEQYLNKLTFAIQDNDNLQAVLSRKKRYKGHVYQEVKHDYDRIKRHYITNENKAYIDLINSQKLVSPKKYTAVSLFAGCGGVSLGFSWAGFDVKGFVEIDDSLREIYTANFPKTSLIGTDITKVSNEHVSTFKERAGEIDIIIGGPPCQGFSLSGKRDVNDPRNTLFRHYLRFVDVLRPKVAILENVRLLTSMKAEDGTLVRAAIEKEFTQREYHISHYEINAKDYGVPQHRERVIFVAIRKDVGFLPSFPPPTHGERTTLLEHTKPYRTFADACSDLKYLESGEKSDDSLHTAVKHPQHVIDWLWNVKEGYSAHDNADPNKRPPSGYNTTYKRQIWLEPASTVQTTFGMISGCRNVHPIATRSLTIREAARIQSFPDSFIFKGTQGTIRTGIGNAVPPLLAYNIANHVASILQRLQSCKNNPPQD